MKERDNVAFILLVIQYNILGRLITTPHGWGARPDMLTFYAYVHIQTM